MKATTQAMVDTVVNMDFDYLALLDMKNNSYVIHAKAGTATPLPPFTSGDYAAEVEAYAHTYLLEEGVERNICEMSCENLRKQLASQDIYTTFCAMKAESCSRRG